MRYGEGRRLGRGSPGGGSRDQFTQQTDDTPQSSVGPLDHLGSHLRRLRCPKCSSQMIQDERAVQRQAARIGALKAKTSCAPCSHCGAAVCMACGRVLSNARTECCPMARLYVTWVLLCGLPADRAENRGEESERAEARLADMLAALNRMLPRPSGTSQFDRQPPSALVEMFRSSPLFIRMAAMIRQGTTQDLAARHALYEQVFGVIETLQSHPVLAEVVHGELRTYGPESMLFSMTMHPSGARGPGVASRPLLGLLQDLRSSARGSDAMRIGQLVAASGAVGSAQRPLSRGGTGSGRSTSSRAGSSRAGPSSTPRPGPSGTPRPASSGSSRAGPSRTPRPGSSGTPRPGLSANGEDRFHREHCVEALDDDIIMEHFPFLDVHRMLNERTRPGRMKRILRELSVLSSSLPPGIWVKHAAGRPDAIKVIIEGPRDTPYEFGLFEFSMLCTNEFPQKPPEMVWSPRRSCPHKINANLHEDGIVCLSLLGTWHGEAWNPAKSSLLQVLVSVQALIFNEHPYCNEPGSEDMAGSPESDEYNALIHGLCLRHYVQAIHCREMKQTFWRPIVEYIRARDGRDMVRAAERWAAGEGRRVHLRESDRPQVHEFRRWLGRS